MLFLSTLSLRRATRRSQEIHGQQAISIHALLAESDALRAWAATESRYFYPRSPCGERPQPQQRRGRRLVISIHALLAESDGGSNKHKGQALEISIHALLAESDDQASASAAAAKISIHALLAESDIKIPPDVTFKDVFLSTLSLRRATLDSWVFCKISPISIHALLAESDVTRSPDIANRMRISIHALLAESDVAAQFYRAAGRAISIHALLAESDCRPDQHRDAPPKFLSTLSLRRATGRGIKLPAQMGFLSTLSLRRATVRKLDGGGAGGFLSTLSLRRATCSSAAPSVTALISIHALLAESDGIK